MLRGAPSAASAVILIALMQIVARGAAAFLAATTSTHTFSRTTPIVTGSRAIRTTAVATYRRGAPLMLFSRMFGSDKPDPATNLAATPALSKTKSEEEWAKVLSPTQFKVLRRKATEPRRVTVSKGGWDDHFAKGTYVCTGCRTPLYTSEMKFDCGCGWPGFWTNIKDAVYEQRDADGFRCEILCSECNGHLGHVFRNEGFPNPPPNERHCVNGVSVAFVPEGKDVKDAVLPTYDGPVYEP